jgi:hypothetical protein
MITEPTIQIEDKGVKIRTGLTNHLGIIMAVDRKRSLKLDQGDRRFATFEASDKYVSNSTYFDALNEEMKNGGLSAMLYDMRYNMPLGKWLPKNNIPETAARNELKEEGLSQTEKFFLDMLKMGECPCHRSDQGAAFISAARLHAFAMKRVGVRGDQVSTVCELARRPASCSTGWWVGPSSLRPIESCVMTKFVRIRMSAASAGNLYRFLAPACALRETSTGHRAFV